MVDFLVLQVRMGKVTVDNFPVKWKDAVITKLNSVD